MNTGLRIKIKRMEKGMSAKELAEKLGVSNQSISLYETEKSLPRPHMMKKMADILETTVEELFFSK